jgi:dinuclear metal center YbgI/SA1388 family protein
VTVADLVERLAPVLAGAAEWDPVGLQLGDPDATAHRVGVCHEVNDRVAEFAVDLDVLVTYHPLLFRPTTTLVAGRSPEGRAHRLVAGGTALVVVHTGWDTAAGGTADALAGALGLEGLAGFAPVDGRPDAPDLGRVGAIEPTTLGHFARGAAERLAAPAVRVAGDRDRPVERVAVLPGSGGDFLTLAADEGADAVVTGDVSHHRAVAALDAGIAVVDVGHAPSERPGMVALVDHLSAFAAVKDLTTIVTNPWEGR